MKAVAVSDGMTQNEVILKHLKMNPKQGITPMDAMNLYSIMRLSGRIYELKERGHHIVTEAVEKKRGKKTIRYARYTLS